MKHQCEKSVRPIDGMSEDGEKNEGRAGESEQTIENEKLKIKKGPTSPGKEEYEKHLASGHAVYRSWCEFCVKGQGKADAHVKAVEKDTEEIPVVSVDYALSLIHI